MKRALALLTLAAGVLAGCATAARPGADTALDLELSHDMHGPRLNLSAPAYVAVFRVGTSNGGARLVYPDPLEEQVPLRGGIQALPAMARTRSLTDRSEGVLYVVASREPLDLSGFADGRDARPVVGTQVIRSNVHEIADALAMAVVRNPESSGWADRLLPNGANTAASRRRNWGSRHIDPCGSYSRSWAIQRGCIRQ